MKKIITSCILFMMCFTVIAENKTKIPKVNKVKVEIEDNDYINNMIFKDVKDNSILLQLDNMEVRKYYSNEDKNKFLVIDRNDIENKVNIYNYWGNLFFVDFSKGYKIQIDDNIHDFKMSNDGKEILYIKEYNHMKNTKCTIGIYRNNMKKIYTLDYSMYTNGGLPQTNIYYLKNNFYISLAEEGFPFELLLMDLKNGKVKEAYRAKRNKDNRLYIEDSEGILIEEEIYNPGV